MVNYELLPNLITIVATWDSSLNKKKSFNFCLLFFCAAQTSKPNFKVRVKMKN